MTSSNETIIHLDFSIEHRDLFRASLEMARLRIAIGIGIAVVFIIALIWFFSVIGEQQMLLELSPLFIGLPILGVAGQILRLHAGCRKYINALPESQRAAQYMFPPNVDGYDVTWGGSFSHIQWPGLLKVVEKPNYFLLFFNRFDATILPKRGFHQHSDIPLFRQLLRSALGEKAKLLSET